MLGGNGSKGGGQEQFKRFLQQVSSGETAAKALQDSFGMSLAVVENELAAYIRRGEFPALRIASADPQAYASYSLQRSSLTEAEANYYLGDLLFHINRESDAERYFKQAIALDPGLLSAHASLGLIYVYQKRYADAKKHRNERPSRRRIIWFITSTPSYSVAKELPQAAASLTTLVRRQR